jgi:hypothetical protein
MSKLHLRKDIKSRLNSGNACYRSVHSLFSSRHLSENLVYRTIILPETWSLTLREVHRLRVFESGVLRGIFGPKMEEVAGGWRRLHNEELQKYY